MTTDGHTTPSPVPPRSEGASATSEAHQAAERETQLRLALEATGLALWTWDVPAMRVTWAPGPAWLPAGSVDTGESGDARGFVDSLVHVDDRAQVRQAAAAARDHGIALDVEFRVTPPDGTVRWVLARSTAARDGQPPGREEPGCEEPVRRITGILLDITERALARSEHHRLLQAERRANRRAAALQRVAAGLSEAATTEQVAAVMVEESLRSLGVGAARIQLRRSDPITGESKGRAADVVRSAGTAQLLSGLPPLDVPAPGPAGPLSGTPTSGAAPHLDTSGGRTRVSLVLADRGRYRGRWTLAWVDKDDDRAAVASQPPLWSPAEWTRRRGSTSCAPSPPSAVRPSTAPSCTNSSGTS